MFERFTDRARRVVVSAQQVAILHGSGSIGAAHILWALAEDPEGISGEVMRPSGLTPENISTLIGSHTQPSDQPPLSRMPFDFEAKNVLINSNLESMTFGDRFIGTEHLLLAILLSYDITVTAIMNYLPVDRAQLRDEVQRLMCRAREEVISNSGQTPAATLPMSEPVNNLLATASEIARSAGREIISVQDIRDALGD